MLLWVFSVLIIAMPATGNTVQPTGKYGGYSLLSFNRYLDEARKRITAELANVSELETLSTKQ